jgi:hypothetical protein
VTGEEFQQTRDRFCESFNYSDCARGSTQTGSEKDGKQGIDYFA